IVPFGLLAFVSGLERMFLVFGPPHGSINKISATGALEEWRGNAQHVEDVTTVRRHYGDPRDPMHRHRPKFHIGACRSSSSWTFHGNHPGNNSRSKGGECRRSQG